MSNSKKLLQSASGYINQSGGDNVEDYFDNTIYKGTGANRYLRTDVDIASTGHNGMVIIKNTVRQSRNFIVTDTVRGTNSQLNINLNYLASTHTDHIKAFEAAALPSITGYHIGNDDQVNQSGDKYAAWTWRCKPKFFDIVTYTGNGTAGRAISHNLAGEVGMMWIKRTDQNAEWAIMHKSFANMQQFLNFGNAALATNNAYWNNTAPTSSTFTVGDHWNTNTNGGTYVAYLFGDDNTEESFIHCGSWTGNGSSTVPKYVNMPFEPQWIAIKNLSSVDNWFQFDTKRGIANEWPHTAGNDYTLYFNHNWGSGGNNHGIMTHAGGIKVSGNTLNNSGDTYAYMAIRRPFMGEPTTYQDVISYQNHSGDSNNPMMGKNLNKAVDFGWWSYNATNFRINFNTRMLQTQKLKFGVDDAKSTDNYVYFNEPCPAQSSHNGILHPRTDRGWYTSSPSSVSSWGFARWKGICDQQIFHTAASAQGNGHALGAVPEFMITKGLYNAGDWIVYHKDMVASNPEQNYLKLNSINALQSSTDPWNNIAPTINQFTTGAHSSINSSNTSLALWLGFASYPDRVDVGYYTGNGSGTSRWIQTALSGTVRMLLVKAANASSQWYWVDVNQFYYYWTWNGASGRIGNGSGQPPLACSSSGQFVVYKNPWQNFDAGTLGSFPLNNNGTRYIYVAFG